MCLAFLSLLEIMVLALIYEKVHIHMNAFFYRGYFCWFYIVIIIASLGLSYNAWYTHPITFHAEKTKDFISLPEGSTYIPPKYLLNLKYNELTMDRILPYNHPNFNPEHKYTVVMITKHHGSNFFIENPD